MNVLLLLSYFGGSTNEAAMSILVFRFLIRDWPRFDLPTTTSHTTFKYYVRAIELGDPTDPALQGSKATRKTMTWGQAEKSTRCTERSAGTNKRIVHLPRDGKDRHEEGLWFSAVRLECWVIRSSGLPWITSCDEVEEDDSEGKQVGLRRRVTCQP